MSRPEDELTREDAGTRRRIVADLAGTLFVEAGAGTGKTRALVDRVVALVKGGRPIEKIVAITFTEKAAAELRDRLRSGLEEARASCPGDEERVQAALDSLDRAQISTIHSFCQSLLHAFAAEAGIDPSFEVQDEVMADRRFEERWRECLEELAGDAEAVAAFDRALSLGLTTRDLQTMARGLMGRGDLAARLLAEPLTANAADWSVLSHAARELDSLPLDTVAENDELRLRIERVLALVANLDRARDGEREAVLAAGAGAMGQKFGSSSTGAAWGSQETLRVVRGVAKDVCEDLNELLDSCRAEALAELLPFIARFVEGDARRRGAEGALTFDDLILRVRDLLSGSRAAAAALRERYRAMLIDEFQDTDPLQVDIARSFGVDPATGRLEGGRLFLVGDPKQSIYRFRRADMAIYSRTKREIGADCGEPGQLTLNRRSRKPILEWVNDVFVRLIGEEADPSFQPAYHDIHPVRTEELLGPGVAWFGGAVTAARVRVVRQMEAGAIAAQVRAVLDNGWEVQDGHSTRRAEYRDIAVLIPVRSVLTPLERALAGAGIPYRVEGGSLIYQTQEVRDLLNCLTAIDDPADEVAIAGALRSTAFACSDVDLARHKAGGGRFDYLSRSLDGREGPVADALRELKKLHEERHGLSLSALVARVVAERGFVEAGILDEGDRNSFRRMRFVVEQARAFEVNGPETLRAFVSWLERRSGGGIRDNEGASLDDDEDAVRVLTVHGAKGLEFPVVFVAGLGSAPYHGPGMFLIDRADGRVAVRVGSKSRNTRFHLGAFDELDAVEKRHEEAEYRRLLYVAATRARDHLVVSLFQKAGTRGCGAALLIGAGACDAATELPAAADVASGHRGALAGVAVDPPGVTSREAFDAARKALVAASTRQRYTSATAYKQQDERERKGERTDETEPWARGRGATRLGRAVHATVQSLPLAGGDDLVEAFSRAQAVAEAIPERAAEVAELVRKALASEAAQRARAAKRALREVPFAVRVDGRILEGFVDMVIETDEGVEVVDWKTDRIDKGEVTARLKEYEAQASLYVYGLEEATGRRVTRVTYVFVRAGIEASPGDPAELRESALRVLEREEG